MGGRKPGSQWRELGTGLYLGAFELVDGSASLTGLSADADDPSFHAEVTAASHVAIVDHAAIQAAPADGGVLSLSFQLVPGTVPVVRFLIPSDRDGHSFGLIQQSPGGTIVSTPLFVSGMASGTEGGASVSYLRGTASYNPAWPFWAADLTARELAPANAEHLGPVTWTPARCARFRSISIMRRLVIALGNIY